jgi:hypothetical protein
VLSVVKPWMSWASRDPSPTGIRVFRVFRTAGNREPDFAAGAVAGREIPVYLWRAVR